MQTVLADRFVKRKQLSRIAREIVEAVLLALVVLLLLQTTVRNFKVSGSSMYPTLEDGQYLVVNRLVYLPVDMERLSKIVPFWNVSAPEERFAVHPPRRGEIIVFHFPNNPAQDFVKRVVGLPGETVEVRQGAVYVDGRIIPEPYLDTGDRSNARPLSLGPEEYYVLGDNRRNSRDSRSWGAVPEDLILGKVWLIYWPFSAIQVLSVEAPRPP